MKGDFDKYEQQLSGLADAIVTDILSASDEGILAEAMEATGDADRAAKHVDDLISAVKTRIGKSRLAAARAAMERESSQRLRTFALSLEQKKRVLQEFASSDENLRLTLAARKGTEMSENDLDAILQALYELGAIDENGGRR